ncbi:RNA-directed DNA polymerase, eukaryota [Tanacetum coccineum]
MVKGKIFWVRAKEVPSWIPNFEQENDDDSKADDDISNEGIFDDNGDILKLPNEEGVSDIEEVAETIFENDQSNSNVKEDANDAQKDTGDNVHLDGQDEKVDSATKKHSFFNSSNNDTEILVCSGHFKKGDIPSSEGLILQLMDELIKVGQVMGYNMEGCMKKVGDIIDSLGVNDVCWGNFGFEYEYSPAIGNSGGILCIWDPRMFHKFNSMILDYFVMIQGEWVSNGKKIIIFSVYAPQDLSEKKMLWDYMNLVLNNWNGDVVIMGYFNEVR